MSVVNITLKIFRFRTFAYKSDNQRSVENFTLEIFRLHTFACKCDNWRSVEKINFRLHTLLHCFACKSDNWRSVEKIDFRLHTLLHSFACKSDNWRSVGNITLEIPENTPIQSITRSARAHWPILDMLGLEASRIDSRSLGNSWHRDFAALTESVYKLELLPVALYDADDQKATTCTHVGDVP